MALLVEFGDEGPQGLSQFNVDPGGGLVKHDHAGFVHQGLRHQHAALHAARELAHVGARFVGQAQAVQQFVDPSVVVLDPEIPRLDAQRFAHGEKRVEHQLLRHHAQQAAGSGVIGLHIVAMHQDAPGGGAAQTRQGADEGGFSSAVGAEQTEEFALLHIKADLVERFERGCARLFGWVNLGDGLERERWHGRGLF